MDLSEVEKLAELKKKLEKERERLLEKVDEINSILRFIDERLREISFVSAEELLKSEKAPRVIRTIPLLRKGEKLLLRAEVTRDSVIFKLDPEVKIPFNSAPIKYLIKSFDQYVEEDLKAIKEGSLSSDKKLTYIIDEDSEGNLKTIEIYNYNSEERLRDLMGKVRWAVKTLIKELG